MVICKQCNNEIIETTTISKYLCRNCGRIRRAVYKRNLPLDVKIRNSKRDTARRNERKLIEPGFREECRQKDRANYLRKKDKLRERRKRLNIERPFLLRSNKIIHSHRQKGYKIEITMKELEALLIAAPSKCRFCLQLFGKNMWNSMTVDRINNMKVLSAATIRIICYRCNTMKGNMLDNEFIELCRRIADSACL